MVIYKDGEEVNVGNGVTFKLGGKKEKAKWYNKIGCFIGYHLWRWNILRDEEGIMHVNLDDKIPDSARCDWCGIYYK